MTRNRGTVGGSVAHADGAAEIPLCLAALGGTIVVEGPSGRREIAPDDFFVTHYLTTLAPGELVVETPWPQPAPDEGVAFEELALRAGDYALAMVAVVLRRVDGVARDVRVRVGAVTDRPTALAEVERRSTASPLTAASAREAGALAAAARRPARLDPRLGRVPPPPHRHARRARAAARLGAGGVTEISLTVNGRVVVEEVEPRLLLTDFLRHRLGLTGTHVGCEHGVCGACTVRLDGVSVRACCLLAVQADGSAVETVESLAGDALLSPLQDAFKRHHALQCGFCTPGHPDGRRRPALPRRTRRATEIVDMLSGHLCRCTGYAPIVAAIEDARDARPRPEATDEPRAVAARRLRAPSASSEAFPGIRYGELLPRVARIAGGLGVEPGRARRRRPRQPARDRAPLLGRAVGGRRLRAALVAALGGGARLLRRRRRRRRS